MIRRIALVAGAAAFVVVSLLVARWLLADGAERGEIEALLRAQARGDAAGMARRLEGCDERCRSDLERLASRLRSEGDLEIVRYDSRTSHATGPETAPTRVVWTTPGTLPTVQCILVRRTGTALSGPRVTLLRLSAPIGRQDTC